jgi:hypothetical protein
MDIKTINKDGIGNKGAGLRFGKNYLRMLKGEGSCVVQFLNGYAIVVKKMVTKKDNTWDYVYRIATKKDAEEIRNGKL